MTHHAAPGMRWYASIFFLFLFAGCTMSPARRLARGQRDLNQLASFMTGHFSSRVQAERDTGYFNISLVMAPIWPERSDGTWLYVEQAVAATPDKPYRQRVYQLQNPGPNTFTSTIYTIQDAMQFAGLQNDKDKLKQLTFDKIEKKEGCTVTLTRKGNVYEGGTEADQCPSDLRGAKYATTKILLKEGELQSWDQGFDARGKQVWGAVKGGYIFLREKK
jgi:hypothetical protein